jgi:hypothetical protein
VQVNQHGITDPAKELAIEVLRVRTHAHLALLLMGFRDKEVTDELIFQFQNELK